ncbi:MAG: hypothetical protein N2648_02005 [Aquificaceae bacterium]|nr:hypothetical protein [Aquificaceae bacterium]
MVLTLLVFILTSCAGISKRGGEGGSLEVLSCVPTIDPKALRPAVCGKCSIEVKAGRLMVTETKNCPPYEVYRCTRRDGKTFFINNLQCKPYEDGVSK